MAKHATLLDALGGEDGCFRLSESFYARVKDEPVLHTLFPGKSLRCATEEFAAFLVQFLGGDEDHTQKRWWLSLHESHERFHISPTERGAWLKHMRATLDSLPLDDEVRQSLQQFFVHSSGYMVDKPVEPAKHRELSQRWDEQLALDETIRALADGRDADAMSSATQFATRPSVFVGVLVRMMQTGRKDPIGFVMDALEKDPSIATHHFAGKTLLHYAAAAGCLDVVRMLLRSGMDPNVQDNGQHTPLYSAANECATAAGPDIVHTLVDAGADVNWQGGNTHATPLHMAARRGHLEVARALLACGANPVAKDRKGETPYERAVNCRRQAVAALLAGVKAAAHV